MSILDDYDVIKTTPPEPQEENWIPCDVCGEPIYYWEDGQDYCVEIDGDCICEDCIKDYMIDNFKHKLEVKTKDGED